MRNKILIVISILSLIVSCKAQTTYSQKTLEEQSNQINSFLEKKTTNKGDKSILTVNDILKQLKVPVVSYSTDSSSEDFDHVKLLILRFYTNDKEYSYKMANSMQLNNIYIYIKTPILMDDATLLARRYQGKWNKEVADFFGNLEVESVNAK